MFPHPIPNSVHGTVILQQPVVISPVCKKKIILKLKHSNITRVAQFVLSGAKTCLYSWWCNRGLQAAQTAAGADGWCFQAKALLQTSAARNLHPCTHQQRAGRNQPGGWATDHCRYVGQSTSFSMDVWDLFDLHCDVVVLNALNWSKSSHTTKENPTENLRHINIWSLCCQVMDFLDWKHQ